MYMYKKLLVLDHLILSKDYVAHLLTSCYNLQTRFLSITDQQIISETFVTSSLFILVCEGNTYNLLVQRNYFEK